MKNLTLLIAAILMSSLSFSQADMGVSKVLNPVDGSILENGMSYTIMVRVKNYGSTTINDIDIQFNVGSNTPASESLTSVGLAPGDSIDVTFTNQWTVTNISNGNGASGTTNNDDEPLNNGVILSYTMTPSSIAQHQANQKVVLKELYPNPSSETLNFILWGNDEVTVKVISMDGKMVYSKQFQLAGGENNLFIPVNGLPRGNYIFQTDFKEGTVERKFQITE